MSPNNHDGVLGYVSIMNAINRLRTSLSEMDQSREG